MLPGSTGVTTEQLQAGEPEEIVGIAALTVDGNERFDRFCRAENGRRIAPRNNATTPRNPPISARRTFEAVEIPLDDIARQNAEMNAAGDGYTEADIAQDAADWIEANRSTVDGWLEQARSAS